MDVKKMTDEDWKKRLSPEAYRVLREKGTEAPFTGRFTNNFETGMYECGACGQELFSSDTKFDSDCGWPSFDRSIEGNVAFHTDTSFGMTRTEVVCSNCGSHLGHIFDDLPADATHQALQAGGPKPKRFCINSAALNFTPKK